SLASGRLAVMETAIASAGTELERIAPAEVLIAEEANDDFLHGSAARWKHLPPWQFELDAAKRALVQQFETHDLTGFGAGELGASLCAAGALLEYARVTQGT